MYSKINHPDFSNFILPQQYFQQISEHAAHVTEDGRPSRAISIIQMKAAIESNKARDNGPLDYADPHTQHLHHYFFA
jgi:hypothetical protein